MKNVEKYRFFAKFWAKIRKKFTKFSSNFEIEAVQRIANLVETLLFLSFFLSDSQNTRDYPKMLIFKGGTAISCGHIYACILEIHRNRPEMGV